MNITVTILPGFTIAYDTQEDKCQVTIPLAQPVEVPAEHLFRGIRYLEAAKTQVPLFSDPQVHYGK